MEAIKAVDPFGTMHRNPDTLERASHIAKLDLFIKLKCREVRTHPSCKTTSKCEL